MKKILVPTDFSEQSDYAMDLACQIARRAGAQVSVLHLVDMSGFIDYAAIGNSYSMLGATAGIAFDEKVLKSLQESAEEKMDEFVGRFSNKDVDIIHKIEFGNAFQNITQEIKDNQVNLTVMGSRGASGIEEFLVGSNTEKVVRHANCPVITVKSKVDFDKIKDIVYASKFTHDETNVISELKKILDITNARLHLVRVVTPNAFESSRNIKSIISKYAEKHALENYTINIYNEIVEEDGIIYFARDIEADMIALSTHGRSGLMHLLSGSIAEDVVNHARRPVWTFRLKH